ncbi:Hypothetical protein CINCED_3A013628 [Cinara cedri]|uniref:Uncharacterized protein n=1 Tax=Cinara cedri TaxID=506608 RepID=A0A5E4MPQ7_9HEMI|nr:Hypothetical protein CINCED_3A013628 [Cinara cedri]
MTVPERNKVLMFAVTMISVFGMSYCCSSGLNTCFELAYVYESQEVYENRTRNIHRNFKIDSEDFEEIKNHYKQLLSK